MGGGSRDPVKVVIINTQYVETDAVSFKSVVQRLTGKDSTAAADAAEGRKRLKSRNEPVLNRGMSFKDFDKMLKELPPLDELVRVDRSLILHLLASKATEVVKGPFSNRARDCEDDGPACAQLDHLQGWFYCMGNKLGRRRQVVDEKYTRPQGLYQHKDVDHKKLRKLILDSKLAPCYPGDDDCGCDLEECPICFLEEQRVIEAKIRMRQQELQDEEERMLKQRETGLLAEDEFDLDLEDIMVMEAIWLSIQENGRHQDPPYSDAAQSQEYSVVEDRSSSAMIAPVSGSSSSSPSGGLACAIAALAERQQTSGETSNNYNENISAYNMPGCSRFSNRQSENYFPAESAIVVSPDSQLAMNGDDGEWLDRRSQMAEVGTSYGGSNEFDDAISPNAIPQQDENQCGLQRVNGPIVPESFEEQMMLAMAVSLAEARARTSTPGVAWQ
ncbi:hypothetical protein DH2020_011695 [Rehmannia glutinosa]|uniref:VQ domain-containing protein n=1 Tax=Rehmannia glutinosa TaxID=99300 RepID=A0ABR0XE61_REHGL